MTSERTIRVVSIVAAVAALGGIGLVFARFASEGQRPTPTVISGATTLVVASVVGVLTPNKTRFQIAAKVIATIAILVGVYYLLHIGPV